MDEWTIDDGWRADVRAARMHLYCDHDALALRNVIHARESLLRDQGPRRPALPHLASAQWLVRTTATTKPTPRCRLRWTMAEARRAARLSTASRRCSRRGSRRRAR